MQEELYNRGQVEENLKKISHEIDEVLEQENVDMEKYTSLMFQQLMQGLYLQL